MSIEYKFSLERDWIGNCGMQDYNQREKLAIVLRRLRIKLLTSLESEEYLAAKIGYRVNLVFASTLFVSFNVNTSMFEHIFGNNSKYRNEYFLIYNS